MIYGPIGMSVEVIDDIAELRITLLILTIVAFLVFYVGRFMGKTKAFLLIVAYLSFTVFIVSKAMELDWAVQLGEILRSTF